nr:chloramphenicol acetyltransferase-like domain-containing protein [Tanacetum cinerariifolium]
MNEEEIRKNIEHEYMKQILIEEEKKTIAAEKAIQKEFSKEAVRLTLEEEARYEKEYQDKIREDEEGEPGWRLTEDAPTTEQSVSAQPSVAATETTPKGKTIKADAAEPPKLKKQGRKRKIVDPSAAELPFRIYHKNRGRSERIFNQKMKKTGFGPNGEGSTADKAFSL